MNTEDFVTYEQAVKLKKCGFDWPCYEFWDNSFCLDGTPVKIRKLKSEPKICFMYECNSMLDKMGCDLITAPSLAMAAKWLREEWDLHIDASPFTDGYTDADGRKCDEWEFWDFGIMRVSNGSFVVGYGDREFDTYEAALSAGIDAALKLLKE